MWRLALSPETGKEVRHPVPVGFSVTVIASTVARGQVENRIETIGNRRQALRDGEVCSDPLDPVGELFNRPPDAPHLGVTAQEPKAESSAHQSAASNQYAQNLLLLKKLCFIGLHRVRSGLAEDLSVPQTAQGHPEVRNVFNQMRGNGLQGGTVRGSCPSADNHLGAVADQAAQSG